MLQCDARPVPRLSVLAISSKHVQLMSIHVHVENLIGQKPLPSETGPADNAGCGAPDRMLGTICAVHYMQLTCNMTAC